MARPKGTRPNDLPPWSTVSQQTPRWLKAGVFAAGPEGTPHDLRMLLRAIAGRPPQPRGAIFDRRTRQPSPESGERAGSDGQKRRKGSKVPLAVDGAPSGPGQWLALLVTPANAQDRKQVAELAQKVQAATGESGEVAVVDQGDSGEQAAEDAEQHGTRREVVKLPTAKRGSCCCRAAGWSSARTPGWRASAAWPATTSACRRRSPSSIFSPSRSWWLNASSPSWSNVHNRL